MSIKKSLGGDRLGSGGKMDVHLKNYGRSSHNLGRAWRSTMAVGTLVPFMVEPTLPGDTFDIDLTTLVRTLPTNGPVFGSFKMQLDVFTCPIRLYNAQLHNNKLGIGMEMEKVKFPQLHLKANNPRRNRGSLNKQQISPSSLISYLGIRGLGKDPDKWIDETVDGDSEVARAFNGMPLLMYWDIYKNYYANKQEEIGMVVNPEAITKTSNITNIYPGVPDPKPIPVDWPSPLRLEELISEGTGIKVHTWGLTANDIYVNTENEDIEPYLLKSFFGKVTWETDLDMEDGDTIVYYEELTDDITIYNVHTTGFTEGVMKHTITPDIGEIVDSKIKLEKFDLKKLDDTREEILRQSNTYPYVIDGEANKRGLPYDATAAVISNNPTTNASKLDLAGLAIKTYQSDRFNNWLSTEWIDGANGIASVTAVDTSSGKFTMDSLNLAQKVYDMLNRIAVSGGSYNDWQEAIWGEKVRGIAETPIYMGGMSTEIVFNEVVSTADAVADNVHQQPLGTLAGKGTNMDSKGGTIIIKTKEPSFIMGIVSITPRIDYSQGNKWWNRLFTMNDLHKPALDGIGFQELLTDEMAAFDTDIQEGDPIERPHYRSAGKQPAWIHYMTSQSETYGNFADENKEMFMTLNRNYEFDEKGDILDLTTYIDPVKYNYAFADTRLDAQNFWVQIAMDVTARRKMSAKIIPNL